MTETKQSKLPLIDGIPDLWMSLKLERPMTPREYRFLADGLSAKMQEWLQKLAPGSGALEFHPGYEVLAQHDDWLADKLEAIKTLLQQKEKPESLRIIGIVQDMLRKDAAEIRKQNEEELAKLEPKGEADGNG